MAASYETLKLHCDDRGVARLTLARPAVHNSMSIDLIRELRRAIAEIEGMSACRAVVFAAEGESFCAGGDLRWMQAIVAQSRAQRVAESGELAAMLYELNRLSRPLVGRIHGPAYGGGLGLVGCCDVAIASRAARFSLTEVTFGLVPANVAPYVARKLGEANARRVFFTGKMMSADDAAAIGLVAKAVDPGELDEAIEAELVSILRCAPGAVAATKRLVDYVLRHDDHDNRLYTADRLADAWETEEGREGIRAFIEKRAPSWRRS